MECVSLHTYRTAGEWTDAEGMEKGTGREGVRMVYDWRAGAGTFTWTDGKKYVGEYKDGRRNGQGEARVKRLLRGGQERKDGACSVGEAECGWRLTGGARLLGLRPLGEMVRGLTPSWALFPRAVPAAGGSARSGCGCRLKLVLLTPPIETSHLALYPCFDHFRFLPPYIHPAVGQDMREKNILWIGAYFRESACGDDEPGCV